MLEKKSAAAASGSGTASAARLPSALLPSSLASWCSQPQGLCCSSTSARNYLTLISRQIPILFPVCPTGSGSSRNGSRRFTQSLFFLPLVLTLLICILEVLQADLMLLDDMGGAFIQASECQIRPELSGEAGF